MAKRGRVEQHKHDGFLRWLKEREPERGAGRKGYVVYTNPGGEKARAACALLRGLQLYPDLIVLREPRRNLYLIAEVETEGTVTDTEARQWAAYSECGVPFTLYVPEGYGFKAREIIESTQIEVPLPRGLREYGYADSRTEPTSIDGATRAKIHYDRSWSPVTTERILDRLVAKCRWNVVARNRGVSTREVTDEAGVSWDAASAHLRYLESRGMVHLARGRQTTRWLPKPGAEFLPLHKTAVKLPDARMRGVLGLAERLKSSPPHATVETEVTNIGKMTITLSDSDKDGLTFQIATDKPIFDKDFFPVVSKDEKLVGVERHVFGKRVRVMLLGKRDSVEVIPTMVRLLLPSRDKEACSRFVAYYVKWLATVYWPMLEEYERM